MSAGDPVVESWRSNDAGDHALAEAAHGARVGHRPGEPPPLDDGDQVPGCDCLRCRVLAGGGSADHAGLVERFVRRRLEVERIGRSIRGPCPIHDRDDPNFSIDPDRGVFKGFVCGASGGDAIALVQAVGGVGFPDAVRFLAHGASASRNPAEREPIR